MTSPNAPGSCNQFTSNATQEMKGNRGNEISINKHSPVVHWDTKPPTVIPPVPTDVLSTSSNLSDRETICLSKTDSFGYLLFLSKSKC